MPDPIVHIEFRSFDLGRTAAFYAKLFDWQTQQNASSTYMKLDAEDGPSAGWVRAELSQSPGPLAFIAVDDLTSKLQEIEKAGGRVIVPKMPFAGGGEIGLFADPDGNVVGLWMRKDRAGAGPAPKSEAKPEGKAEAKPATKSVTRPAASAGKSVDKKTKAPKKR
jgi:predicted enzyme related to lactoylglutathione lyase